MPKEIERKFLVNDFSAIPVGKGYLIKQGYLPLYGKTSVRVRRYQDVAFITIKGKRKGAVRSEFQYPIPANEADEILSEVCKKPFIEKLRYKVVHHGLTWVVDVFEGANKGLILAEIELEQENQSIPMPEWIGEEVTEDARYYNANLSKCPFKKWK